MLSIVIEDVARLATVDDLKTRNCEAIASFTEVL
jgi:hypothetical protein